MDQKINCEMKAMFLDDGKLVFEIGEHLIEESDIGAVFFRFKEINTGYYSQKEAKEEFEKTLKEYDYNKEEGE